MDFQLGFIVAGLVGFIVGLTGVGGGSLMTPIYFWFGITTYRQLEQICCMQLLLKWVAYLYIMKKKYQLVYHGLAISR
jgi:uncharacterized membrane protein YfcA